jgi:hypothetical protein
MRLSITTHAPVVLEPKSQAFSPKLTAELILEAAALPAAA